MTGMPNQLKSSARQLKKIVRRLPRNIANGGIKINTHGRKIFRATMNTRPNYECKLYIGSVHHRTNKPFFQPDVEVFCGEVQKDYEFIVPVRITPTTFISSTNYHENGWEITAIDYPKLDFSPKQIRLFMLHLANRLLTQFKQNTICVIDNETIEMIT